MVFTRLFVPGKILYDERRVSQFSERCCDDELARNATPFPAQSAGPGILKPFPSDTTYNRPSFYQGGTITGFNILEYFS